MAPNEHTRTGSNPPLPRRRQRRTVALALGVVLASLTITGCTWLDSTSGIGSVRAARWSATAGGAAVLASQAIETDATSRSDDPIRTAGSEAKVASGEVVEVIARITEASIDPGSCGTVAYTPDSASAVQVGNLCVPAQHTRSTVIVLVHGGGGTGGSRTDLASWQEAYAARGYTTFSIDYRLTDVETDDRVWPEPEQDVKAAIQFVRLAGSALDADHVVVQGHSAGARLGGVILTTPDDTTFQGPEVWTGASDAIDGFVGFYGYYDGFQFEWDAYYGEGSDTPVASRTDANAVDASGPALLITGSDDSLVGASESRDLAAALDAAGGGGTLIELGGREHGFDQVDLELTADGSRMVDQIERWITTHIESSSAQGSAGAAPACARNAHGPDLRLRWSGP